jgi:hypothetical protein
LLTELVALAWAAFCAFFTTSGMFATWVRKSASSVSRVCAHCF